MGGCLGWDGQKRPDGGGSILAGSEGGRREPRRLWEKSVLAQGTVPAELLRSEGTWWLGGSKQPLWVEHGEGVGAEGGRWQVNSEVGG